ncbi:SOS response-associated peptidase [Tenacibaculum sp. 190524A05c]|uniref:SOS response-associated peptidase n=1 Tax=Tenacibaculum platacis TaxID=3137852 RepID=UPI0031FB5110
MCFTKSNTKSAEENERRFNASFIAPEIYQPYYARSGYSTDYLYIIKQNEKETINPAYWGLLPEHLTIDKRSEYLRQYKTYNARVDKILNKQNRAAHFIKSQRCIILADGIYEPHDRHDISYPHYIKHEDHSLFALAGVYTELDDGLYTTTILTREANPYFAKIHNRKKEGTYRMPLILNQENESDWLSGNLNMNDVTELMNSFTIKKFVDYPVRKRSGQPLNESEGIEPFFYPEQQSLF